MKDTINLKKGDTVAVTVGKDKGKTGKISEVDRKSNMLVVEGMNIHHRFKKAGAGKPGTKVSFAAHMPAGKVVLICPHCGKATRVAHKFLDNGTKQRVCKHCAKAI
jgi:large subunit ribosomal protein L24